MAYLVLTLVISFVALFVAYLNNLYGYWQKRNVPHEHPLPLFGNMKGIGRTLHFRDVNQRLYERFKRITPIAGMYMFFSKAVLILDLELIKHVLIKDFSSFHDRGIFHNVRDDPLTGHLLTLEGDEWRAMRNKLSPTFTSGKMKHMFPILVTVGERLAQAFGDIAQKDNDGVLEVKEMSARYTTDVIGSCAFGIECNSLEDPNAEFRQKGRSLLEEPRHSQLVQAFMITNRKLAQKLRMKFFPDHISEFFIQAVRNTIEYRQKNNIKRNDFMDMLIEMKASNEAAAKHVSNIDLSQGLTLEQIAAQCFVFFLAGFETSSSTMSFCLYELAVNQHVQDKLRKEILDAIKKHDDKISYEMIMNDMHYLDQVVDETLRKYPLLPHIVREAVSDYRVPNTSYVIEKGTTVLIPTHAIHHDADFYPEPEKFDPDRFAPDSEALEKRHSAAYLPFGDGPRNCIGMRFGKMQTKVGLVSLLKSFKFTTTKRTEMVFSKKNFLLSTENGIFLKAEKL